MKNALTCILAVAVTAAINYGLDLPIFACLVVGAAVGLVCAKIMNV